MRHAIGIAAASFAAVVLTACNSGDSMDSSGGPVPSCGSTTGKGVSIPVSPADWNASTSLFAGPLPGDTTTTFSGTATFSGPVQITDVKAGDTITVQVVFTDSLGISAAALPYVSISLGGGSGFLSAASYFTLAQQGNWGLQTGNTGIYGATAGVINGYWLNMTANSPAVGSELYCFTSRFAVPSSLGGQAIGPGQTIPVTQARWSVTLPGDMTAMPSPVVAR